MISKAPAVKALASLLTGAQATPLPQLLLQQQDNPF
jgi:hypothetical protein